MKKRLIGSYRCPVVHSSLSLGDNAEIDGENVIQGKLGAEGGRKYSVAQGIPDFIYPDELCDSEAGAKASYDSVAEKIYDAAVDWQFKAICESEDEVREGMLDSLRIGSGSRVLEVGCGTGRDSFRIARRLDESGTLYMQDLSPNMVFTCRERMAGYHEEMKFSCDLHYFVSNASYLPFPDGYFDAVFHFGGFNEFGEQKKAASEFARVTRDGGRVLFGDESVAPWLRGTEFDGIVTTNNAMFKHELPLDTLPEGAREVECKWVMGNCFYVISFTKGNGPPPLDLDLPHAGWRGGTMRTRYFGNLEGVTPEAKEAAIKAAKASGKSVHQWLDDLIRSASNA